ncbi:Cpe/LpqF family protein [Nonomuraea sp. NPDC050540]|uniref:Cpe/LpqF family protein n=1 Tax=Nonomuraea sp. NPDC050540 TaxID=3364367 RepID=UPI003787CDE4
MKAVRVLATVLAAVSIAAAGCGGGGRAAVAVPDSPAGKQLSWYMDAVNRTPVADKELKEHLSATFLKEIPPEEFNRLAKTLAGLKMTELTEVKPDALKGRASASGQEYKTEISVDDAGKIDYLLITG